MDNRLVLTVLFVTLSWISMGINAQTNTTGAPNATMAANMSTAMGSNMTGAPNATTAPHMSTAMGSNMTGAPNTTMAPHMSTAMGNSMTGATNATMTGNMTTAMGNSMTGATNATMTGNMTTAMGNSMTGATNATMTGNMTTAMGNNTAAASPTTAAPLMTNTTVETLGTNVTRSGCGTKQVCADEPDNCDPSTSGSCFFFAAKVLSGQNFEFQLAGESEGYIATSLSSDSTVGGNDTTYVCANNNSAVMFFGALLNDGQLTMKELPVNSVKGRVTGNKIECTFAATVPDSSAATARAAATFSMIISNGTFDSSTGTLGLPNIRLKSNLVDLANPNVTVTNTLSANSTAAPTTTNHAITLQQSLMHALLVTVGVLGLTTL